MSAVAVITNPVHPEPVEIIAQSIIEIAAAMRRIDSSRLTRKAIVALLHDTSKISKRDIDCILDHLAYLEKAWIKAPVTTPAKERA